MINATHFFQVDQSELPKVSRMAVYRIWQLDTVITRVLSIVLVLVVYFSHWQSSYVIYNFRIPGSLTLGRTRFSS